MSTTKKIVLYSLAFIALAIVLGIAYLYAEFNSSKYNDQYQADLKYLQYYKDTYVDARIDFRSRSNELIAKFPDAQLFNIPVASQHGTGLTVDLLYIPAQKDSSKILIISSGTHGVEGYVGSAVQKMIMNNQIDETFLENSGILLIHAVNPYGFKYTRRVTENNVDLNRNSSVTNDLYKTVNEGYPQVYDLINPKGKLDVSSFANRFFFIKAIAQIAQKGMPVLRQAILQGQYAFPEALYFGGQANEPQIEMLKPIIKNICQPYKTVFAIDLHTGYGERGTLHLFPNPVEGEMKNRMEKMFEGYHIDWGDTDDFYTVTGDFLNYIGQLNTGKIFIPMTFEYGTMNSQTTMGSLRSIHIMIKENQGHQYGYDSPEDSISIKHDILEMYYPSSESWRTKVMADSELMFAEIIPRFIENK